jgi:hypothetical protein
LSMATQLIRNDDRCDLPHRRDGTVAHRRPR